jgi:hypothetical protein
VQFPVASLVENTQRCYEFHSVVLSVCTVAAAVKPMSVLCLWKSPWMWLVPHYISFLCVRKNFFFPLSVNRVEVVDESRDRVLQSPFERPHRTARVYCPYYTSQGSPMIVWRKFWTNLANGPLGEGFSPHHASQQTLEWNIPLFSRLPCMPYENRAPSKRADLSACTLARGGGARQLLTQRCGA